ncbi:MAG: FecR domain-containing protein [Lunatimonas sp.]|uniref:FecR family protein n=1 Tax=Lunatimonas sp. TaxID=2060141 RepID=UPI00263BB41C|nr:FecR domain-containing protein [Lunatimonas sp.]MCC5936055.1 FecR domain-containing protein [Lunatimonas sp.]
MNLTWENRIDAYPEKIREIKLARDLVVNLPSSTYHLSDTEKESLWERIDATTNISQDFRKSTKVFPLNSQSTIKRMDRMPVRRTLFGQGYRVAFILGLAFSVGILASLLSREEIISKETPLVYTEHVTPSGVKSTILLPDSSKVILNSGSKLYYQEHFSGVYREVFLEGEAYFEVTKDPNRSFIVNAGTSSTTALGTSFNIDAYSQERINIYLITGNVKVVSIDSWETDTYLGVGESVSVVQGKLSEKKAFDNEKITAWTKGLIIFDNTPIHEAIRVMENWFDVTFHLENSPPSNLQVSGRFDNETLKNILTGLSFSTRFQFEIDTNVIHVRFIKP